MPTVNLTHDELTIIAQALDTELKGATRSQKNGKSPQIREVYRLHEAAVKATQVKVIQASNSK